MPMQLAIKIVLVSSATLAILVGLWWVTFFVLSSSKGFETSDEALYLLVARELRGESQWGFPFGWHTAPIYLAAGSDVANFRTLGGVILGVIGSSLAVAGFLVAGDISSIRGLSEKRANLWSTLVFALVGYAGALFYYASLIRAPSYNWVNLVGLLLACSGLLVFIWIGRNVQKVIPRYTQILVSTLVGAALFYTIPGKPSSPFLFLAVAIPVLILLFGLRRGVVISGQIILAGLAMIPLAVLTGLWPVDFYRFFSRPLEAPPLSESFSIGSALVDLALFPVSLSEGILSDSVSVTIFAFVVLSAFIARIHSKSRRAAVLSFGVGILSLSLWHLGIRSFLLGDELVLGQWANNETGLALWILFFGSMAFFLQSPPKLSSTSRSRSFSNRIILSAFLLGWSSLVFGFGSSNSLIGMTAHSGATLLVASLMMARAKSANLRSHPFQWPVALFAIGASISIIVSSHYHPYRLNPLALQNEPLSLWDRGQSVLFVDRETASEFTELFIFLDAEGFEVGDRLISLEWTWSSAVPYATGASVPRSAMPTLFGYSGSLPLLDFHLSQDCQTFDCSESWLITTKTESLDVEGAEDIRESMAKFYEVTEDGLDERDFIFSEVGDRLVRVP